MAARDWSRALELLFDLSEVPERDYLASICCMNLGDMPQALAFAQCAVMSAFRSPAAWSQLGAVHYLMAADGPAHYLEAHTCFEQAYTMSNHVPAAAMGLGASCFTLGFYDGALELFQKAQRHGPYPKAQLSEAGVLLLLRQYEEGWRNLEARIAMVDGPKAPCFTRNLSDLIGKSVLVCAEQGLGDCIQFMRYVPKLRHYCAQVIVEAYPGLESLTFAFTETTTVTAPADVVVDVRINIMSLPLLLMAEIGAEPIPPLPVPAQFRGPRSGIGICPATVPLERDDLVYASAMAARKNPPLDMMKDLATEFGPMRSLMHADLETENWLQTAMVVAGLDLVITVDTALAHLAASLGVETWVMQRFDQCWRWNDGWYQSARIFRQASPGDWGSVYRQMREALQNR